MGSLKDLIIKRKDDSLKLRHYFFKWIRIARMQKIYIRYY